jgi:hypothetical protein
VLGKEMLPEQILAVVISVRRAHDGADVIVDIEDGASSLVGALSK